MDIDRLAVMDAQMHEPRVRSGPFTAAALRAEVERLRAENEALRDEVRVLTLIVESEPKPGPERYEPQPRLKW
jgi:hypothetical protein